MRTINLAARVTGTLNLAARYLTTKNLAADYDTTRNLSARYIKHETDDIQVVDLQGKVGGS
jgi:hypothetical protein